MQDINPLYSLEFHTPSESAWETKHKSPVFLQTKCNTICFSRIHSEFLSDTKDKLPRLIKDQDTRKEDWFLNMPKFVGNITLKDSSFIWFLVVVCSSHYLSQSCIKMYFNYFCKPPPLFHRGYLVNYVHTFQKEQKLISQFVCTM